MRWKITILETKLIFNGPVFHFHDCGRKSRWRFLIFTTASTMASCTSAVAPQWLAQPETLRCGFVKALYVPLFPRIRESYRQTNTSSAKTIKNISNQPWFHNLSQEIWSNLMALNWKSLGSQPRCLPYNQRKKKKTQFSHVWSTCTGLIREQRTGKLCDAGVTAAVRAGTT